MTCPQTDNRCTLATAESLPEKSACHLRQTDLRARDLTRAGTAGELLMNFDDLRDAGGADRMAAAGQAAAGIHRDAAAERGVAVLQKADGFAAAAEQKVFDVEQFLRRRGIVDFGDCDVARVDAGSFVSAAGRALGGIAVGRTARDA